MKKLSRGDRFSSCFTPRKRSFIILILAFATILSCQKRPIQDIDPLGMTESDISTIKDKAGVGFKILKSVTEGISPCHKFLWVSISDNIGLGNAEKLAREILDVLSQKFPNRYHSFTIHFFDGRKLKGKLEDCPPFADATFLPNGDWSKVGLMPIDNYKEYKLKITLDN